MKQFHFPINLFLCTLKIKIRWCAISGFRHKLPGYHTILVHEYPPFCNLISWISSYLRGSVSISYKSKDIPRYVYSLPCIFIYTFISINLFLIIPKRPFIGTWIIILFITLNSKRKQSMQLILSIFGQSKIYIATISFKIYIATISF